MKAQSGLKFSSELCFGIINTAKDSYLQNSKVAFLKRGQNAAGICSFFLRWLGEIQNALPKKNPTNYKMDSISLFSFPLQIFELLSSDFYTFYPK